MNDLVLITSEYHELRINNKGQYYRYDKVLNILVDLTDSEAKQMLVSHLSGYQSGLMARPKSPAKLVRDFVLYGYNFESGFIQKVWSGTLADHLQSKFNDFYNRYGAAQVFFKFYTELSIENQHKLANYITENYNG